MPEIRDDQAAGLRRLARPNPVRVITVTSGKGGVGKTNVSVNLAVSMAQSGKEVVLMDADLGLANIDVMLGIQPAFNLSHVINGRRSLEEIMVEGPAGIKIIPAASGIRQMTNLGTSEHAGLVHAFSELGRDLDVLIVDTSAGISESVVTFTRAAQEVIVVVCDEPASITDAYALMKLLSRDYDQRRFRVLANMTRDANEGRELFRKISMVTDRFLDVSLDYIGAIPSDDLLRRAIQKQRAVVDSYPGAKASLAFKKLAELADKWPMPRQASGRLEFFVERLIQGVPARGEVAG